MIFHTRSHTSGSGLPRGLLAALLLVATATALPASVSAQYFGRNKVQYETFDFKILKTPHFDIHFYPEEGEAVEDAARMAERWYEYEKSWDPSPGVRLGNRVRMTEKGMTGSPR